ncbi:MAG: SusC/RagA family TonB-linked outer membrane protein [Sphingobacteriaceae bacterium]|nr:SusC/RagA family TonB-linked outer membrane protein [Sphingobacteriaceae bacterium]
MHNFTTIKKGFLLLTLLAIAVFKGYSQDDQVDSTQFATDTTTVAVQRNVKGVKHAGKVVDGNTHLPLNGVSISIPGFSATITNDKGEFSITIPDYKSTIQVSSLGYHTKLYPVFKGKPTEVTLYPDTYPSLFASVNLPGGSKSLSRTVAAVSANSGQTWSSNSETIASAYQGQLSGVNTVRRSGTSGIGAELFVRGFTSLYGTNKPLVVVDGMIFDTNSYGTSLTSGHINNTLQSIDPRDIASITIIKDAVQSAAYGTRAANGLILVTTNSATDLATRIDFSAYGGVNSTPRSYPVMNAYNFRAYSADLLTSRGFSDAQIQAQPYMNEDRAANPQYYIYNNETKWSKQVFRNSYDQNYYLRISGGDNVAKYSLSLGYLKDKGITDSTDYMRYNTRFNADLNLTQRLTGKVGLAFTYGLQNLKDQGISPISNPIFLSLVKSPFVSLNTRGANGAVSPKLSDVDSLGIGNPRALIENGLNTKKVYRFFGSTNFDYKFNNTFKVSTLLGITYDKDQESIFIPRYGVANEISGTTIIDSRLGTQVVRYSGLATDTRLNYTKTINNLHKLNAVAGFRFNDNSSEEDRARGVNSGTDQLVSIGNSNVSNRIYGGGIGRWRTLNTYLTGDYSYADKYLVNLSLAVDGSSRFGKGIDNAIAIGGNKLAVLPAVGAAWLISSEDFMKDSKNIDLLKLRLSYGLVGNDDIGNYTARKSYRSQNLVGVQGLIRGNLANPALQWETIQKFNAGLDAALFKELLSFSVDFWNHRTNKMITEVKVAELTAGINSYLGNNASMSTSGIDLGVNARILNSNGLRWDAGLTVGTYKNKVNQLGSSAILTDFANGTYLTTVGKEANLFYGYRTNGVYATQAAANAAGLSIKLPSEALVPFGAGDMQFIDINGDKIINEDDRVVLGNPNPDLFGSFNNTLSYKKWRLDALFTFVTGNDVYNYTRAQLESGSAMYNQTNVMLNRWRYEGQVTNIPKATYGDPMGNSRFSDRWIEDGSYLRLRTLALTYSLPFTGKAFKYLNVYATANNLVTLTKYKGFDPEFSAGESIFAQGVDVTLEPQTRSFQLGLRLGL